MKKCLVIVGLFLLSSATGAIASPGILFGLSYNFGGSVGLSLKVLSTNKENHGALAVGTSYYPLTKKFGLDTGVAYLTKDAAVSLGWDFLGNKPQVGVGYVNTKKTHDAGPPPAAPR